jgi:hypothetical protein
MRHLIKLLILLVIVFVIVGFWQGWISFTSSQTADANGNKVNLGLTVDKEKMKAEVKGAKDKIKEEVKELRDKVRSKTATPDATKLNAEKPKDVK